MLEETRQSLGDRLGAMWCGLMHNAPMWPIHGQYRCGDCGRQYPVRWAEDAEPRIHQQPSASLGSAVLGLIVVLALLAPAQTRAAEIRTVAAPAAASNQAAAMAFARYLAGHVQTANWNAEAIEVDACLPGMKKQGRLLAVRRLLLGKPEYEVLEIAGDKTVRQQVILRYLSAETQAAAVPAYLVAITPANYSFRYNGQVEIADAKAYSFSIKPRKKREGLIRGELWIDAATGAVLRQSGYLVKNPSIFVKRVTVTRVTEVREGFAEERITHLSIDTRLIGRAELIIHERPCPDIDGKRGPGVGLGAVDRKSLPLQAIAGNEER